MKRIARHSYFWLTTLAASWLLSLPVGMAAPSTNVFQSFTTHISNQVNSDKHGFARASSCTEWFYKRLKEKPQIPQAEGISYSPLPDRSPSPNQRVLISLNCTSQYPNGLEGAREDFSQRQSTLALSLTFYQFALIGDKNDDGDYNDVELEDTFKSLGLHAQMGWAPSRHARVLNNLFDELHQQGQLDILVEGMSFLLEKGYRLTPHDRAALQKLSG